jgi:hypothetical protein
VHANQPNTADAYEQLTAHLTDSHARFAGSKSSHSRDMPALPDRRPSHLMNEMLALRPIGGNNDEYLFTGLLLRKLPTSMQDYLAAADGKVVTAMAKHMDVPWNACCSNSAVIAINSSEVDAVTKTKNAINPRSPLIV